MEALVPTGPKHNEFSAAETEAIFAKHVDQKHPVAEVTSDTGLYKFRLTADGPLVHVRVFEGRPEMKDGQLVLDDGKPKLCYSETASLIFEKGAPRDGVDFTAPAGCGDLAMRPEPFKTALHFLSQIPSSNPEPSLLEGASFTFKA